MVPDTSSQTRFLRTPYRTALSALADHCRRTSRERNRLEDERGARRGTEDSVKVLVLRARGRSAALLQDRRLGPEEVA